MGIFDRLFGRQEQPVPRRPASGRGQPGQGAEPLSDEQALARYRYMIRTAPPEMIEQAHEEAFAQLTPQQRAQVLREMSQALPDYERAAASASQADPKSLARLATRAELRQPGTMERLFGGGGMGMGGLGMGTMMAGTIFGSLVAGFVGSMIANQFFDAHPFPGDLGYDQEPGYVDDSGEPVPAEEFDAGMEDADLLNDDFGDDFGGSEF